MGDVAFTVTATVTTILRDGQTAFERAAITIAGIVLRDTHGRIAQAEAILACFTGAVFRAAGACFEMHEIARTVSATGATILCTGEAILEGIRITGTVAAGKVRDAKGSVANTLAARFRVTATVCVAAGTGFAVEQVARAVATACSAVDFAGLTILKDKWIAGAVAT
jgi:hypothetical protein